MGKHSAADGQPSTYQQNGGRANRDHQPQHRAGASSATTDIGPTARMAGSDLPSRDGGPAGSR